MADIKLTERERLTTYNGLDDVYVVRHNNSYKMRASLLRQSTTSNAEVGNFIVNGDVIYLGDLDYHAWVTGFTINNVKYETAVHQNLTLSDGDATHPRIDVFAVDISSGTPTIVVEEGTPSATPLEPSLDLTTQVRLVIREVPASATSDGDTTTNLIYDENTEWTNNYAQTGSDLDYTIDPYVNTKCIKTLATDEDYFQWTKGSTNTYTGTDTLVLALKIPTTIESNSDFRLQLKLINSSTSSYWLINLTISELIKLGYLTGVSGEWQLVQIPLSQFQTSSRSATEYDRLEFRFFNAPLFYTDFINIQSVVTRNSDYEEVDETLQTLKISLSASEVSNLATTPIVLIPAQGIGTIISVINAVIKLNYGTTDFDLGDAHVRSTGSTQDVLDILAAYINDSADVISQVNDHSEKGALAENTNIEIYADSDASQGDGTVDLYLTYQIIQL